LPHFFLGVALCDMEFLEEWRPLDYIRFNGETAFDWIMSILKNCFLIWVFLSYGMVDEKGCFYDLKVDDRCPYI
jgi:hypothetical protein